MGAAVHDFPLAFPPAAMTRAMALAYTSVSEAQLKTWEREGVVRFLPRGANGTMITERAQLEEALRQLFSDPTEDMDFGDADGN